MNCIEFNYFLKTKVPHQGDDYIRATWFGSDLSIYGTHCT